MKLGMLLIISWILAVCSNDPKVISENKDVHAGHRTSGIFGEDSSHTGHNHNPQPIEEGLHTVIAKKALPTQKYVYVLVQEGEQEEYWIATTKQEIVPGNAYFFRDGLLKTNFESREHNMTFDKIFFVSKLVASDHGNKSSGNNKKVTGSDKSIDLKGSVKISELVANPKKYEGKTIQVSGECLKINSNIMGRNWIHINDGTTKDYDLVITSGSSVQVGQTFIMTGTVALDKDFGSGYRYDILLENGILVKQD